jgi:hypothetical protein
MAFMADTPVRAAIRQVRQGRVVRSDIDDRARYERFDTTGLRSHLAPPQSHIVAVYLGW